MKKVTVNDKHYNEIDRMGFAPAMLRLSEGFVENSTELYMVETWGLGPTGARPKHQIVHTLVGLHYVRILPKSECPLLPGDYVDGRVLPGQVMRLWLTNK
jgi:hypothetical protein